MPFVKTTIAMMLALAACGGNSSPASPDAPAGSIDAPASATCAGGDHFVLRGAFALDTVNFNFVTSGGRIAGVGGSVNGDLVAFGLRSFVTPPDLESDHDIAITNLKELRQPLNSSCNTPGTCSGFYALAGTYHVSSVHPRYSATFTLSDLRERHTATDPPGAPIAGTITGCIDLANP
jgi:hypothetical protein